MVEWCWRAGSIRFTIYSVDHFFSPREAKNVEEFVIEHGGERVFIIPSS